MYGFDGDFDKKTQPKKQPDLGAGCFLALVLLLVIVICAQVYLFMSYVCC
jgi:hypothetical protein